MEDSESGEKQENTGIGPASACRDSPTPLCVPDAVQRVTKWSHKRGHARRRRAMAPLIRDRHRLERSTQVGLARLARIWAPISGKPEIGVCSASLRFASRCAAPGTRVRTNLRLYEIAAGAVRLFPGCYLQRLAQPQRVEPSARGPVGQRGHGETGALTPLHARAARRARCDDPRSPPESRNRARPAAGCREFHPPCSRWRARH
jgi:hypothetical protein